MYLRCFASRDKSRKNVAHPSYSEKRWEAVRFVAGPQPSRERGKRSLLFLQGGVRYRMPHPPIISRGKRGVVRVGVLRTRDQATRSMRGDHLGRRLERAPFRGDFARCRGMVEKLITTSFQGKVAGSQASSRSPY